MVNDPCTSSEGARKKAWATEAAAEFVAREMHRKTGVHYGWYACPACGKWHTTKAISGLTSDRSTRRKCPHFAAKTSRDWLTLPESAV